MYIHACDPYHKQLPSHLTFLPNRLLLYVRIDEILPFSRIIELILFHKQFKIFHRTPEIYLHDYKEERALQVLEPQMCMPCASGGPQIKGMHKFSILFFFSNLGLIIRLCNIFREFKPRRTNHKLFHTGTRIVSLF